ncbi:hypothetical protein STAQ_02850 [Allostella sp. ATCC 35155]|nr:hypothetical protein STAQ_02850 [Stella sp. ATCC 35155]
MGQLKYELAPVHDIKRSLKIVKREFALNSEHYAPHNSCLALEAIEPTD